ncbi:MAG TPA: response regulator [Candidatus Nitrosotenuis sp.]|jgi:two-component system response regulator|nr:response regulator [Candidatus Nitrosotenuis sp.]
MQFPQIVEPIQILLVEDSLPDAELIREFFAESKVLNRIEHVEDGEAALAYLRQEGPYREAGRPDLVVLDLNLPRLDGRRVLEEIRADPALAHLPVVVLTSSAAEEDILRSYRLHANAYITKPPDLQQFARVVRAIQDFWLSIVKLPRP